MKCNISYINNSTVAPRVKNRLAQEHRAIFDRIQKSGQFSSFNKDGKRGYYISAPSQYSTLRDTQLAVLEDINRDYKSRASTQIVGTAVSNGREVVNVNVLPLTAHFIEMLNPVSQVINPELVDNSVEPDTEESEYSFRIPEQLASRVMNPEQDAIVRLADRLKTKTGIPYILINNKNLRERGRFTMVNGVPTVQINLAHANESTAIHEYLHPFILAVKQDRPDLYYGLIGEVIKNHQDIIKQVENLPYANDFVLEEALVRVLTEYAGKTDRPSIIDEFFLWLQDWISWITGTKYPVIGTDLKLKKLAYEFTASDSLHDKLEDVRSLKELNDYFEILDEQFESVVNTKAFGELMEAAGNKINLFRSLVKDKPQLFSESYLEGLEDVENPIKKLQEEGKKDSVSQEAMVQSLLDYVTAAARNTTKVQREFNANGGVFSQINELIRKGPEGNPNYTKQLNEYLRQIESVRNYFHLYGEFKRIEELADEINAGETDDYDRTIVLDHMNSMIKKLTTNPTLISALKADPNKLRDFNRIKDTVTSVNNGNIINVDVAARISFLLDRLEPNIENIKNEFDSVLAKNKVDKTASGAIREVRANVEAVRRNFTSNYRRLLTEILWQKVPPGAPITKEMLEAQIGTADADTGTMDTWLSATISSRDALSAITARLFNDLNYENADRVNKTRYRLQAAYKKANPNNQDSEAFHRKYIGEMKVLLKNPDGSLQEAEGDDPFVVSPFDGKRYKVEIRKRIRNGIREDLKNIDGQLFWRELDKLGVTAAMIRGVRKKDRLAHLTQLVGEQNAERAVEVLERSQGLKNSYVDSGAILDPYIKEVLAVYKEAQEFLPPDLRLKSTEISQVRKDESFMQRLGIKVREFKDEVTNGEDGTWLERFFQWLFKSMEAEQYISDEGNTLRRAYLDGQEVYDVKVRFTKRLNPEDLLEDLFSTTLAFYESAGRYNSYSSLEPTINALKTVLVGDPEMEVIARDARKTKDGAPEFNGRLKQYLKKKMGINVNKRLTEFINDVVYGESNLDDTTFKLNGRTYAASKIANKALGFASLQNIAFNFISGMSNSVTGNVNTISLAIGGKYFKHKHYWQAVGEFRRNLPNVLQDFTENDVRKKSKITQLVLFLDAIQGEWIDFDGKSLNQSAAQKLLTSNALYFTQSGTEFQVQATGMIALLKGTEVNGKSLWDLATVGENGLEWDKSVTPEIIATTRNRLHALSKQLHGNYNKFDKGALQRRWYGNLILMFRKFLYTSYRARFGSKKYDYELEDETEGYYRKSKDSVVDIYRDFKPGEGFFAKLTGAVTDWQALASTYRSMDENGQAAIKRTAFEMSVILGAILIGQAIAKAEIDDDDDPVLAFFTNNIYLQSLRLSKDFGMYTPVVGFEDLMTILRTPTVVIPSVDKVGRLLLQVLPPNTFETYERATGIAEKGDNKAWIMFLKAAPVVRQILNLLNSQEQIKFYTMLNRNVQ